MDKRQLIVESALKLFSENGFQATSTTSITNDAGVGTGTLFIYFKNKDQLVFRTYLEAKEKYTTASKFGIDEQASIKSKLRKVWYNAIDWISKNQNSYQFMLQFDASPLMERLTNERANVGFKFLTDLLHKGVQQEILGDYNVNFLLELFSAQLNTTIQHIKRSNDQPTILVENGFLIFWKGVSS